MPGRSSGWILEAFNTRSSLLKGMKARAPLISLLERVVEILLVVVLHRRPLLPLRRRRAVVLLSPLPPLLQVVLPQRVVVLLPALAAHLPMLQPLATVASPQMLRDPCRLGPSPPPALAVGPRGPRQHSLLQLVRRRRHRLAPYPLELRLSGQHLLGQHLSVQAQGITHRCQRPHPPRHMLLRRMRVLVLRQMWVLLLRLMRALLLRRMRVLDLP